MDPVTYVPLPTIEVMPSAPQPPPELSVFSESSDDHINVFVIQRPQLSEANHKWGLYCGYILILVIVIIVVLYSLSHLIKPKN